MQILGKFFVGLLWIDFYGSFMRADFLNCLDLDQDTTLRMRLKFSSQKTLALVTEMIPMVYGIARTFS
jgi:hypothetical protein